MAALEIRPNPAFAGQTPRLLTPTCHDRTPFITVACDCGFQLHLHESQLVGMPAGYTIITRCHDCSKLLELRGDDLVGAFKQMRDDGWIK